MNPVLTLARNALPLTQRCLDSVRAQDIETTIFVIDNDSSDGTFAWLQTQTDLLYLRARPQLGVSAGWNAGLRGFFDDPRCDHVLVVNNDVELPQDFYSQLLDIAERHSIPFLTGVAVESREELRNRHAWAPVPHPDFSAFLIHRAAWERIGPFDEAMRLYASDCDYHLRGWRAAVPMMKANVPFYHERSSTLRTASESERAIIERQAEDDRIVLQCKWGCRPGDPAYADHFTPSYWGVDAPQ